MATPGSRPRRRASGRTRSGLTGSASPAVGQGAGSPSLRTAARPGSRLAQHRGVLDDDQLQAEPSLPLAEGAHVAPRLYRGVRLTRRAVFVLVVLAVIALSLVSSLRVYLAQQQAVTTAEHQIAQRSEHISQLQDQVARWQDADYVRAQARERLGWVLPGETGYVVIGPDGKPYGAPQVNPAGLGEAGQPQAWWQKIWGSVRTVDQPAPSPSPTQDKTVSAPPSPSPTR